MKTKLLLLAILLMTNFFSTKASTQYVPILGAINLNLVTDNYVGFTISIIINGGGKANTYVQHNTSNAWLAPLATTKIGAPNASTTLSGSIGGLTPGTVYYIRVYSANTDGTTTSQVIMITTINTLSGLAPVISNISATDIKDTKANVNFTLNAQNNGTVSYNVQYSTDANFGAGSVSTTAIKTTTGATLTETITGLTASTQYYYKVVATSGVNNAQSTTSPVNTFTTLEVQPLTAIAEFKFDNSYTSESSNISFAQNNGTSFTADRHGNATGAININNAGTTATIADLPYGSASRSISVWAKTNVLNNQINYIFHYGNSANGNGLAFRPGTILFFANAAANLEIANTITNNTWVHYVCTYDGTTAKVYKNGILLSSGAKTFNTVSSLNIFKLGLTEDGFSNYFNGAIDDLKIYDVELTQTQVTALYTNNALTSNKALKYNDYKISVYPNPASDRIVFENGAENTHKAIFNLQGAKLAETVENNISVKHLPSGIYIVKFTTADGQKGYSKFTKK